MHSKPRAHCGHVNYAYTRVRYLGQARDLTQTAAKKPSVECR